MPIRIKDPSELEDLADRLKAEADVLKARIYVCSSDRCLVNGSLKVGAALQDGIHKQGLTKEVRVIESGCMGPCAWGPLAVVYPDNVLYERIKPEDAKEIVEQHLLKDQIVARLTHKKSGSDERVSKLEEIDFFRKQKRKILRNCGVIDPMRIEDYIIHDGYVALTKAVIEMRPDEVTKMVTQSGLRDRNGEGCSLGLKWSQMKEEEGKEKFIHCNTEGIDPEDYIGQSLIEGNPHALIEGIAIGGYATGASKGCIYFHKESSLAIKRLEQAIEQARAHGILGENILGTSFGFNLEIRTGSGVLGHNVETYANIPLIILEGTDEYPPVGTIKNKGTKVFLLTGSVINRGLIEVPFGIPLGEIIYDIGEGIIRNKKFKAAQIGGPFGRFISQEGLNMKVDYESLQEIYSTMDSSRLIIMDEDTCMVDKARDFLRFLQNEFFRKGGIDCPKEVSDMLDIVSGICEGKGQEGDIEKLESLGSKIKNSVLCRWGETALNPVLSSIQSFREEFESHIGEKYCPAGVCPNLVRAPCQNACPAGVDVPGYIGLISERRYGEALRLHRERNPFAAVCARVCFHSCEEKCRRAWLDEPISIRGLKRFMADQEATPEIPEIREDRERAKRKVAIIGAGPAGLSCAYFLARLGYRPKVFEAETQPGGMLVQTIPPYRLPRKILMREIKLIERMGVKIKTGVRLGKDFTLQGLRDEGYEVVFIGVGAMRGRRLGVPGEDLKGVTEAIQFLRQYNLRGSVPVGRKVVVIGGGNAAIDAARTAIRLGAKSVTILYRRTRDEMPAYAEEIEEAKKEGVVLKVLVSPVKVIGKNKRVKGVKCTPMVLGEFDRSGRRRPLPSDKRNFILEADQVITAIGQGIDPQGIIEDSPLGSNEANFIEADSTTGQTPVKWIFAGGDAVAGPSSVVSAVGWGERAAVGIDEYLMGESHPFWREEKRVPFCFDPEFGLSDDRRARIEKIPLANRKGNFKEIELSWPEDGALCEAKRCLRCDWKITITMDQQKCKGCMLCAHVCAKNLFSSAENLNTLGFIPVQVKGEECIGCLSCAIICPDNVFEIRRQNEPTPRAKARGFRPLAYLS